MLLASGQLPNSALDVAIPEQLQRSLVDKLVTGGGRQLLVNTVDLLAVESQNFADCVPPFFLNFDIVLVCGLPVAE